jgi:hypothetical protein
MNGDRVEEMLWRQLQEVKSAALKLTKKEY